MQYATTMQLQVNIRHMEPDITAVILDGKIALGQGSQYIEGLVRELLGKGKKKIILDISGVTYIDSAGLGMLTLSSSSVAAAGGKFAVAGAASLPAKLFQITKLDTIISLYPSVDAACRAFADGKAAGA